MRNLTRITYLLAAVIALASCNRVNPNFEGVLMQNYGRDGVSSFTKVTGAQGMLGPGTELYQVPMYEQTADPDVVYITAKDAGSFSVDPRYTYEAMRDNGVNVIFNYKHVGVSGDADSMMNNIERMVLSPLVINAYRDVARRYSTDSLMNNLSTYEIEVEDTLRRNFIAKYFNLKSLTSGLRPPQSMSDAIERRNNAKQYAEQVKNELEVAKMQLEKSRVEAERDKINSTGLTPEILQQQWIEAIRNTNNKVIITDGRTPIILNN